MAKTLKKVLTINECALMKEFASSTKCFGIKFGYFQTQIFKVKIKILMETFSIKARFQTKKVFFVKSKLCLKTMFIV